MSILVYFLGAIGPPGQIPFLGDVCVYSVDDDKMAVDDPDVERIVAVGPQPPPPLPPSPPPPPAYYYPAGPREQVMDKEEEVNQFESDPETASQQPDFVGSTATVATSVLGNHIARFFRPNKRNKLHNAKPMDTEDLSDDEDL